MGIRREGTFAHPLEQLSKGGVAGQVGAKDEHVGEVADQALDFLASPGGDVRADDDVEPQV